MQLSITQNNHHDTRDRTRKKTSEDSSFSCTKKEWSQNFDSWLVPLIGDHRHNVPCSLPGEARSEERASGILELLPPSCTA